MSDSKRRKLADATERRHPTALMVEDMWRYVLFAFITDIGDWCALRSTCRFFRELSETECDRLCLDELPHDPQPCPWPVRHLHLTDQTEYVVFNNQWAGRHLQTLEIETNMMIDVTIPPGMTVDALRLKGVLPEDVKGDFGCRELSVEQVARDDAVWASDLEGLSELVQRTGASRVCVICTCVDDFGGPVRITELTTETVSTKALRQICPDSLLSWSALFDHFGYDIDSLPVFRNVSTAVFRVTCLSASGLAHINRCLPQAKISIKVLCICETLCLMPSMPELSAHMTIALHDTNTVAEKNRMASLHTGRFHPQTTVEFV